MSETSASSCSRSRWYRSRRSSHSSRLPNRLKPRRPRCLCPWHMVTSLLVSVEERRDELLVRAQGVGPRGEQAASLVGELVDPLAGPGRVVAPLRGDDPVLLEGAQHAVEVAHVDPALARQRGELLEQLVPVGGTFGQEKE